MSSHLIQVDETKQQISTFRIQPGSARVLFTTYSFEQARIAGFDAFARQLGEDLILDSREMRDVFRI